MRWHQRSKVNVRTSVHRQSDNVGIHRVRAVDVVMAKSPCSRTSVQFMVLRHAVARNVNIQNTPPTIAVNSSIERIPNFTRRTRSTLMHIKIDTATAQMGAKTRKKGPGLELDCQPPFQYPKPHNIPLDERLSSLAIKLRSFVLPYSSPAPQPCLPRGVYVIHVVLGCSLRANRISGNCNEIKPSSVVMVVSRKVTESQRE
jgi:hypothetical protein